MTGVCTPYPYWGCCSGRNPPSRGNPHSGQNAAPSGSIAPHLVQNRSPSMTARTVLSDNTLSNDALGAPGYSEPVQTGTHSATGELHASACQALRSVRSQESVVAQVVGHRVHALRSAPGEFRERAVHKRSPDSSVPRAGGDDDHGELAVERSGGTVQQGAVRLHQGSEVRLASAPCDEDVEEGHGYAGAGHMEPAVGRQPSGHHPQQRPILLPDEGERRFGEHSLHVRGPGARAVAAPLEPYGAYQLGCRGDVPALHVADHPSDFLHTEDATRGIWRHMNTWSLL